MENINKIIETLNGSAIFNFSLSSKELFHSNFISWLGNKYPLIFGDFFKDYLNKKEENPLKSIEREKHNIDILLSYSDNQKIVIENKVKSVAYKNQLVKYSGFNSEHNTSYILLSFSKPSFFEEKENISIEGIRWNFVSYSFLKEKMINTIDLISDEYDKKILWDYINLIENLIKVDSLCQVSEHDFFDFYSLYYSELFKIRIHDLYLKKKSENLAFLLYQKLNKMEIFKNKLSEFGLGFNIENTQKPIFIGYGMTRAMGLVDLKYVVNPNFVLGIQIQGDHYRIVAEGNNAISKKDDLLKENLWFDLAKNFPNKEIYPKGDKAFNMFKPHFFYRSVKLENTMTVREILDIAVRDIEYIEQNIQVLKFL